MKSILYRFLILCAGSDEDILAKCPRSEHIKHAGFGSLVLVPATLGLFSMTYAISTFVENPFVYIAAGVTWAGIIFIFDRFLISTFRKKDSISKRCYLCYFFIEGDFFSVCRCSGCASFDIAILSSKYRGEYGRGGTCKNRQH